MVKNYKKVESRAIPRVEFFVTFSEEIYEEEDEERENGSLALAL